MLLLLLLQQMYWLWVKWWASCRWYREARWVVRLRSSKVAAVCPVITLIITLLVTLAFVVMLLLVGVPRVCMPAVSVSVPVSAVPGAAAAATFCLSTPLLLPAPVVMRKQRQQKGQC
jgi:hypothetical protein